jgi:Flp pilus assembly protein TadG
MRKSGARSGWSPKRAGWWRFQHEEKGYALTLTLVALPFIIGVAAWVIDASRVTNLHTDLQDAVDAMALAGARELDGRDDAIPRARAAIAAMAGNTASFANGGDGFSMGAKNTPVSYNAATGAGNVTVQFMEGIPASDDDPIGANNCVTPDGKAALCDVEKAGLSVAEASNRAGYVRVISSEMNVRTMFLIPGLGRDDVPVRTEAVATYTAAACDVTPIFICNPFESTGNPDIHENFRQGNLYARQLTMSLRGSQTAGPGNFGYLAVGGSGADFLRNALATNSPGECYARNKVETEPGGNIGPAEQGLGTRFGIYGGSMSGGGAQAPANNPAYRPARNVRMGQDYGNNKKSPSCSKYEPEANPNDAMPLPGGTGATALGGGSISTDGNWDLAAYWRVSHNGATPPTIPMNSRPPEASAAAPKPSRYDVYRYELANPSLLQDAAPGGEKGIPPSQCYGNYSLDDYPSEADVYGDRRTIFAAIVNCNEHQAEMNGRVPIKAEAFARMFLTKPMVTNGSDKYIALEVVDISGAGGMGTVENFLHEEAELVR